MIDGQVHNVVAIEFRHAGDYAMVKCAAETEDDDAIQICLDSLSEQGIDHDDIVRLYSERQPPETWIHYFAENLPHVAVTWSFGPGEEAEFKAAVEKLLRDAEKPWWKFW